MLRDFFRLLLVVIFVCWSIAIEVTDEVVSDSSKLVLINYADEPIDLFWVKPGKSLSKMTFHPLRNGTNILASSLYLMLVELNKIYRVIT